MKYFLAIQLLLGIGCRDTHIDLTPPPAPAAETVAPVSAPLVTYSNGHPISWPFDTDYADVENAWLVAINEARLEHGVPTLSIDTLALEGARAHAFHMTLHAFMAPANPEGDGPFERYLRLGAYYRTVREACLKTNTVDATLFGPGLYATDVNHIAVGAWRAPEAGIYFVVVDFTWR